MKENCKLQATAALPPRGGEGKSSWCSLDMKHERPQILSCHFEVEINHWEHNPDRQGLSCSTGNELGITGKKLQQKAIEGRRFQFSS
jgi:hypothetical protein